MRNGLSSLPVSFVCLLYYYTDFIVSFHWSGVSEFIVFYSKLLYCTVTTIYVLFNRDCYTNGCPVSAKFVSYSSIE